MSSTAPLHVPVQNSSPVIMVSAFHTFSSAMDFQTVWISQMNHLVVEENAKLMSGSAEMGVVLRNRLCVMGLMTVETRQTK